MLCTVILVCNYMFTFVLIVCVQSKLKEKHDEELQALKVKPLFFTFWHFEYDLQNSWTNTKKVEELWNEIAHKCTDEDGFPDTNIFLYLTFNRMILISLRLLCVGREKKAWYPNVFYILSSPRISGNMKFLLCYINLSKAADFSHVKGSCEQWWGSDEALCLQKWSTHLSIPAK